MEFWENSFNLLQLRIEQDDKKQRLNYKTPHTNFLPSSALLIHSWIFFHLPTSSMKGWGMGVSSQSITLCPCCSFLFILSHCSSVNYSHGLKSFRNRLLQRRLSMGLSPWQKTCPGFKLLSTGHSSCQEPTSAWTLHGLKLTSSISTCCSVRLSTPCSINISCTWSSLWTVGKSLLQHLEHLLHLHLLLTDFGVCRAVSFPFSSLLSHASTV